MKISKKRLKQIIREELNVLFEKAPPRREKQVLALKNVRGVNPYAIAWAQHNKYGYPKNESDENQELDPNKPAKVRAPSKWWDTMKSAVNTALEIDDDEAEKVVARVWDEDYDDDQRSEARKEYGEV